MIGFTFRGARVRPASAPEAGPRRTRLLLAACALLSASAFAGCVVDDVGPSIDCGECAAVIEPGGAAEFHAEWFDEPCDNDSRAAGPLLRYCTEVDVDRVVDCGGRCEVVADAIDPARFTVVAREAGPLEVEVTMTRRDTGERHVEIHSFEVGLADSLSLGCETELDSDACRRRTRSGGGDYFTIEVRGTRAGRPVALDLEGVSGLERVHGVGVGVYQGTVDVGPGASEVTVMSAGGASATLALPAI